jgi:hypothetical protein
MAAVAAMNSVLMAHGLAGGANDEASGAGCVLFLA